MTLAAKLYVGILFHLLGDYFLQNDYMGYHKGRNTWMALLHVTIYSFPFLFIVDPLWWGLLVFLPHFLVDRFSLGTLYLRLRNWKWDTPHGFDERVPEGLRWCSYIAVDNGIHLFTNTMAIWLSS